MAADRTPICFEKLDGEEYSVEITWLVLPSGAATVTGGQATAIKVSDGSDATSIVLASAGAMTAISGSQTTFGVQAGIVAETYQIKAIADTDDGQKIGEIFDMLVV